MNTQNKAKGSLPLPYLAESKSLIHKGLPLIAHAFWIVGIIALVVGLVRIFDLYMSGHSLDDVHFLPQLLSCVLFVPYIPVMLYAEKLSRTRPRLGTRITLLATLTILAIQLLLNGHEAAHGMIASLVILICTGFLSSIMLSRCSTRATQKKNQLLAAHDTLTDLPNRYYSEQTFDSFFATMKPDETGFVLFVDVDNFKLINTRFGHQGGDLALQAVARRLQQVAATHQAITCRVGGDEFVVMLICPSENIQGISQQILDKVAEPFGVFGDTLQLTCSIGITRLNEGESFQTVYHQADIAMHRAKYAGKNTLIEHNQAYIDEERKNADILMHLQQACKNREYRLCYQPQVDLQTGEIIGMEALVRWEYEGRDLSPEIFIPIAEQHGLIHDLTYWAIREACIDCKRCHDLGYKNLFVAVNVSAKVLESDNLASSVTEILEQTGLDPHCLELELTESALFQQGESDGQSQLQQLRKLGIKLSIDDFGTGYSNLHYLGELDIQTLKIDKSFIMQLDDTQKTLDLVLAILDIARRFKLRTVAEGMETKESVSALLNMNCDVGQGFYWSKPISINLLMAFLAKHSGNLALEKPNSAFSLGADLQTA